MSDFIQYFTKIYQILTFYPSARTYIFYCRSPLFYTFVLLLLERSLTPRGSSTCFLHAAGPLSTSASRVGEREAS